jgi:hypothetical protein
MKQRFPVAPWPGRLKIVSGLVTLLLAAAGVAAYRAIPVPTGFTHGFGLAVAFVFPAILVASALFVVSGYVLDGQDLLVTRLFWSTRISLSGLRRIYADPMVCKGSWRVFGNGGLFSFTGLYRNKALGMYRLFATDISRSVVLLLPRRTVVVTPSSPEDFVRSVHMAFPAAATIETTDRSRSEHR